MKLSPSELDFYHRNGFLGVQRPLFSSERFNALRGDVEALIKREVGATESKTVTTLQFKDECFMKWAAAPEILDQVEQIIGPDIALWAVTLFLKRAHSDKFVDWHCDSKVLQAYKAFESLNHVSLLLALTPNTEEQGCVRYIPGSHLVTSERPFKTVPYQNSLFGGIIYSLEESEYKNEMHTAVPVELKEGEYSFHDIHSVHASDANRSDQDRILLNFKYFPTDIVPQPEKLKERLGGVSQDCYLLRGRDKSGRGILRTYSAS